MLTQFKAEELAGTARAFAQIAIFDEPLRSAIASSARPKMQDFDPMALVNTAWAYAKLQDEHAPLLQAIAASSLPRLQLFEDNLQSLVILSDLADALTTFDTCLSSESLRRRLREKLLDRICQKLPRTSSSGDTKSYAERLKVCGVHNFGNVGTRLLLHQISIQEATSDFCLRASTMLGSKQLRPLPEDPDIGGYVEYDVGEGVQSIVSGSRQLLCMELPLISATKLPPPASEVDRTKCTEFKLLSRVVANALESKPRSVAGQWCSIGGFIYLYVMAVPCASCVGVLHQVRNLMPHVRIAVSWTTENEKVVYA